MASACKGSSFAGSWLWTIGVFGLRPEAYSHKLRLTKQLEGWESHFGITERVICQAYMHEKVLYCLPGLIPHEWWRLIRMGGQKGCSGAILFYTSFFTTQPLVVSFIRESPNGSFPHSLLIAQASYPPPPPQRSVLAFPFGKRTQTFRLQLWISLN